MGFKDSVITNVATHLLKSLDKQVDGKQIVDEIQEMLKKKGVPLSAIDAVSEGSLFNITCEMQEGLWRDKKALAAEYQKRASHLLNVAAISPGNQKK